jgi:hypothetical protein
VGPAIVQGLGNSLPHKSNGDGRNLPRAEAYDRTDFVAETLLPTASGKYRLRGYRHTVSLDRCNIFPFGVY